MQAGRCPDRAGKARPPYGDKPRHTRLEPRRRSRTSLQRPCLGWSSNPTAALACPALLPSVAAAGPPAAPSTGRWARQPGGAARSDPRWPGRSGWSRPAASACATRVATWRRSWRRAGSGASPAAISSSVARSKSCTASVFRSAAARTRPFAVMSTSTIMEPRSSRVPRSSKAKVSEPSVASSASGARHVVADGCPAVVGGGHALVADLGSMSLAIGLDVVAHHPLRRVVHHVDQLGRAGVRVRAQAQPPDVRQPAGTPVRHTEGRREDAGVRHRDRTARGHLEVDRRLERAGAAGARRRRARGATTAGPTSRSWGRTPRHGSAIRVPLAAVDCVAVGVAPGVGSPGGASRTPRRSLIGVRTKSMPATIDPSRRTGTMSASSTCSLPRYHCVT